ncbi:MAG TPA: hypothetical protein VHE83_15520 [Mycobacteriales bacterium]|nr:hypothetical protein [Mycobacteriales bacterium]
MKRTATKAVVSVVAAAATGFTVPSIAAATTAAHGKHKVTLIDSLSIVRGKKLPKPPPAPISSKPTSAAPGGSAPTTVAPTTVAPTTVAPTTAAPTTVAPTTAAPTTVAPTTAAPTTVAPTTVAPTTPAPTSSAPTSTAPASPSSSAPVTSWLSGAWPNGANGTSAINAFDAYRGRKSEVATVYHLRDTWDQIANNMWAEGQYNGWNGTLVIAMPLVPTWCNNCATISEVATGVDDHYFTSFAQNLVAMGRGASIIRLGWEFDGGWYPWSSNPNNNDFVNAYRHAALAIRAVDPAAKFDWCGNFGGSGTGSNEFTHDYPGDDVVDYVGVDSYDRQWFPVTDDASWNSYVNHYFGLNAWLSFAKSHHKPLTLPEWGLYSTETGDAPFYIQKMHDFFAANAANIGYELYFNEPADYIANSLTGPDQNPNSSALYAKLWSQQG